VDIRNEGTGNPGAANIYREIGPRSAVVVFLLDLIKGAAATVPIYLLDLPQQAGLVAAGAVLAGHFFPVFWGFKGGTGLVVGMGASLGFLPLGAVIAVPFTVAFAKFSKDMGQAGGVFIVAATVAGALVHRDLFSVVAVLLIGLAIGVKSWTQYGHWQR
jgi:glycerol-3-phosphate acyltransferase PlsY